jgi:2-oxoglutarate dehydrogenase E2 component (dihydrolipoamide succinyltransferase)
MAARAASPAALQSVGGMPMPPSVKKLVAEHGLDATDIPASGRGGRLTKGDVLDYLQSGGKDISALAEPEADRSEERVRMSRLRRRIAERLKEAQNTAAMLTTFNEVDMTEILAARKEYKDDFEKRHGVRLGFMSFFIKAAIQGLRDVPAVNAQIDGDEIVYKNYYDMGVAVGTEQGLVVPIIRNAETLSLAGIEKAIAGLAKKARDGKLSLDDMSGGTFTISNGGVYGSLLSTPILNPPQSGILGMHKTQMRPMVMPDGSIQARPMMYLALSYDHRIVDGSEAVTCLVRMKESLEDPRRLLLDM